MLETFVSVLFQLLQVATTTTPTTRARYATEQAKRARTNFNNRTR